MAVSSVWMLLNIGRALNSRWEMQLQVDATFKVCTEAVGANFCQLLHSNPRSDRKAQTILHEQADLLSVQGHYKCSCADCHRDGVCDHSLMFSMFVDKSICVPAWHVTTQVAKRRKPGRPAEPKPRPKSRCCIEF